MSTRTETNQMDRSTVQMPDNRTAGSRMQETQTRQMPGAMNRQMPDDGRRMMPDRGTETKPAIMSTEFYIYLAAVGGVLLASYLVGTDSFGGDPFRASQAWWLITLLTIAYLGSRGLSKVASSWRSHGERR